MIFLRWLLRINGREYLADLLFFSVHLYFRVGDVLRKVE